MKYLPKQRIYSTRHNCYCIVIKSYTKFGLEYYEVVIDNPKSINHKKEVTLSENNLKSTHHE